MQPNNKSQTIGFAVLIAWMLQQSYMLYTAHWAFVQNINLVFHEAGHTLFIWAPRNWMLLMGSGFEILVPLCVVYLFWKQNHPIGVVFAVWWTGTALWSTGIYIADALPRQLPLIGDLNEAYHDWYNISLDQGWLYQAQSVGDFVYFLGSLTVTAAFVYALHYINKQYNWV